MRRHIADKGTVMRNKDNRAFKGFQETFQPVDGFDIEVVSGLIQQQHARPTDRRGPAPLYVASHRTATPAAHWRQGPAAQSLR